MKKSTPIILLFFAAVLTIISSCGKDSSPTSPDSRSPAELSTSQTSLNFALSALEKSFILKNVGEEKLIWTVTKTPQWATTSKLSGELEGSQSDTILVNANSAGLGIGAHSDSIKIESDGGVVSILCSLNITILIPVNGSYSGTTAEGGSISYSIDDNYVRSFRGSYFLNISGSIYELSTSIPSFGAMSFTASGFEATSFSGYVLKGTFDGDSTITGTWKHDYGTTEYSAKLN